MVDHHGLLEESRLLQHLLLYGYHPDVVNHQGSYNELAQTCSLDTKTVEKYITLLEQSFVVFKLSSLSRNLRNELKKSRKIYFYDNGVRNALIANFNQIENRSDVGVLWENFLVSERMKYNHYSGSWVNSWFWRTSDQGELDYIEETDGRMYAYVFKWNSTSKMKVSKTFTKAYSDAECQVVNPSNFETFLGIG